MEGKAKTSEDLANRQRSGRYPRHNLQKVEAFGRAAFDAGARNLDIDQVAQAANYKDASNGAFKALRASASYFGLIKSAGSGYASLSEEWIQAFNNDDLEQLKQARQHAMLQPQLYRQLFGDYGDRQLPKLEKLTRDLYLNSKYGMLKDAASAAAQTFIESAEYAGLIDSKGFLRQPSGKGIEDDGKHASQTPENPVKGKSGQQVNANPPVQSSATSPVFPLDIENLDRIEIKLVNGAKAYFFVPVPLPFGEKERLKKYIDLLLEAPSRDQQTSQVGRSTEAMDEDEA